MKKGFLIKTSSRDDGGKKGKKSKSLTWNKGFFLNQGSDRTKDTKSNDNLEVKKTDHNSTLLSFENIDNAIDKHFTTDLFTLNSDMNNGKDNDLKEESEKNRSSSLIVEVKNDDTKLIDESRINRKNDITTGSPQSPPLISEMRPTGNNLILPLSEKKEHGERSNSEFLMHEVSSRRKENSSSNIDNNTNSDEVEREITYEQSKYQGEKDPFESSVSSSTLPMELSTLLSKLKKGKRSLRKIGQDSEIKFIQEHKQQYQQSIVMTFLRKMLPLNDTNKSNMSTHQNTFNANMNFIWDSILENIASYAKDKSLFCFSLSLWEQYGSNDDDNWSSFYFMLPPSLHLAFSIMKYCPKYGWDTLLDMMERLTIVLTQSNASQVNIKRHKIQLLGMFILIKTYCNYHLRFLQYGITKKSTVLNRESNTSNDENLGISKLIVKLLPTLLISISLILKQGIFLTSKIVEMYSDRRTLLSSCGVDSVLLTLEYAAMLCKYNAMEVDNSTNISSLIVNSLSTLRSVLQTKLRWSMKKVDKEHESEVLGFQNATKKECLNVVINDWIHLLDDMSDHFSHQKIKQTNSGWIYSSLPLLVDELVGSLIANLNNTCKSMNVGGIAQSLVLDIEASNQNRENDITEYLKAAVHFMGHIEDDTKNNETNQSFQSIIHCLRGACTWISRHKDISYFLENSSTTQDSVNYCLLLIRLKSTRSLIYIRSILNILFSTREGLPEDVHKVDEASVKDIPESFVSLVQEVNFLKNEDFNMMEPSHQLVSDLVERCIIHRPLLLLPYFTVQVQNITFKVEVFVDLLDKSAHSNILPLDQCQEIEQNLFEILPNSKHLQMLLHSKPFVVSHLSPQTLIVLCTDILKSKSTTDYTKSTVTKVLSSYIQKKAATSSHDIVLSLIKAMRSVDEETDEETIKLLKYAESWRKALVYGKECYDNDYSTFIGTICAEMFKNPADSTLLALFASMIGDGHEKEEYSRLCETSALRIKTCVSTSIEMALGNMKINCETMNIFVKLSPLLILRRIPMAQYNLLQSDKESHSIFIALSDIIAFKLGIESNDLIPMVDTVEERKLLAELAPRCFPFSEETKKQTKLLCCYNRFCRPVIYTTLDKIEKGSMTEYDWKRAKVSLYICYHANQLKRQISINDVEESVNFAITALRIQDDDNTNVVELQSGCIDYLAAFIDNIVLTKKYEANRTSAEALIEEIPTPKTEKRKSAQREQTSFNESFVAAMLHIIVADHKTFRNSEKEYFCGVYGYKQWSVASKTCILNVFTVVAKRCPDDKLQSLSSMIVSRLIRWLTSGEIDGSYRHPLCVASMMQFLFTLFMRTNSFSCIEHSTISSQNLLKEIFQLCTHAIQYDDNHNSSESYAVRSMRTVALKLLLIIVTIDQGSSAYNERYFAPGDLSRAMSIVRGSGNVDKDPEFRKLASHLSTVLR